MYFKTILVLAIFIMSNESQIKEIKNITKLKVVKPLLIEDKNTSTPKNSNKEICLLNLNKYAEKNLNSIEKMLSEDIVLRDWKIRVEGKEDALKETRKNFENADSIQIEVLSTYENKTTVAADLKKYS